jgi:hypothetical protein
MRCIGVEERKEIIMEIDMLTTGGCPFPMRIERHDLILTVLMLGSCCLSGLGGNKISTTYILQKNFLC